MREFDIFDAGPLQRKAAKTAYLPHRSSTISKLPPSECGSLIPVAYSLGDTRQLLAMLSLVWAIDDHTCYGLIRRVIEAPYVRALSPLYSKFLISIFDRYPRSTYRFGLDVLLQDAASSYIPTGVADIVKRVLPDSQSFT
jgi:hypothetical protein